MSECGDMQEARIVFVEEGDIFCWNNYIHYLVQAVSASFADLKSQEWIQSGYCSMVASYLAVCCICTVTLLAWLESFWCTCCEFWAHWLLISTGSIPSLCLQAALEHCCCSLFLSLLSPPSPPTEIKENSISTLSPCFHGGKSKQTHTAEQLGRIPILGRPHATELTVHAVSSSSSANKLVSSESSLTTGIIGRSCGHISLTCLARAKWALFTVHPPHLEASVACCHGPHCAWKLGWNLSKPSSWTKKR